MVRRRQKKGQALYRMPSGMKRAGWGAPSTPLGASDIHIHSFIHSPAKRFVLMTCQAPGVPRAEGTAPSSRCHCLEGGGGEGGHMDILGTEK